jgi:exodeoxyribonuclease-3
VNQAYENRHFNVNGINGRLPVLLRWLAEAKPDVVCLQELKAMQDKFPRAAIEVAGYGAIWQGQKSWNGVAILARGNVPIETRRGLPSGWKTRPQPFTSIRLFFDI